MHYQIRRTWWSLPLASLGILGGCGLWVAMLFLLGNVAPFVPVAIVGMVGGSILLWQVVLNKRWAVIGLGVISIFLMAGNFREREAGSVGLDWQVGMKMILWCSYLIVGTFNIRRIVSYFTDPAIFCMALYLAVALLGVTYSEAPLVTVESVVVVFSYIMFGCFVADVSSERDALLLITYTLGVFCLVSLLAAVVVPTIAFPHEVGVGETDDILMRLQGIAGHPNQMGNVARGFMIFLIGAAYMGYLECAIWLPMGIMGTITLIATQSRTSVFVVIIAGITQLPRRFLIPIVILMGLVVTTISISGGTTEIYRMIGRDGSEQEAETMSGRTELWTFTEGLIADRPWLGYGFASFETYAPTAWIDENGKTRTDIVGPHNQYLQLLYDTGIIGTIPWVAMFVILLTRWYNDPYLPRDLLTVSLLLTGYAEAELPSITVVPNLLFFVILAIDIRRRYRQTG